MCHFGLTTLRGDGNKELSREQCSRAIATDGNAYGVEHERAGAPRIKCPGDPPRSAKLSGNLPASQWPLVALQGSTGPNRRPESKRTMLQAIKAGTRTRQASSLYCVWIKSASGDDAPLVAIWIDREMRAFTDEFVAEAEEQAVPSGKRRRRGAAEHDRVSASNRRGTVKRAR